MIKQLIDLLPGILASLIAAVLLSLILSIYRIIRSISRGYDIAGYWIAYFKGIEIDRPEGRTEKINIELVRIRRTQKEKVSLSIWQHNNIQKRPLRSKGHGIFRLHYLSSYWYFTDKSNCESGAFALELTKDTLDGIFVQYLDRKGVKKELYEHEYTLHRVHFSLSKRLLRFLGRNMFSSFAEAKKFVMDNEIQMSASGGKHMIVDD